MPTGQLVQASHQQAHPTTCSHNDLVVRSRRAWWHFGAASVAIVCQSSGLAYGLPQSISEPDAEIGA
jgi:hypothetical protein